MEILEKYPHLKTQFEALYENRRNEILNQMLETDTEYIRLRGKRADASMALKRAIDDSKAYLLENYADSVLAHEIYELDSVYKQAVCDTLILLSKNGII
jgi:hypothetical protein